MVNHACMTEVRQNKAFRLEFITTTSRDMGMLCQNKNRLEILTMTSSDVGMWGLEFLTTTFRDVGMLCKNKTFVFLTTTSRDVVKTKHSNNNF